MEIILNNVWKRYNAGWIIKDLSFTIGSSQSVAIAGPNGSGKSTLLQIISGLLTVSKGKIHYNLGSGSIDGNDMYKFCAMGAAYAEMDEELTITELFEYYSRFKPLIIKDLKEFLDFSEFGGSAHKAVGQFSTGMKQRLMIAFVLNFNVPLLLLDEPGSFLDKERKEWLGRHFENFTKNKTVIIASNDPSDLSLCNDSIHLI